MPKCVADTSYATHVYKSYPVCKHHASLAPEGKATRVLPDRAIPHCKECKHPLAVHDWNNDRLMFLCQNPNCRLMEQSQGGENKHTNGKEVTTLSYATVAQ